MLNRVTLFYLSNQDSTGGLSLVASSVAIARLLRANNIAPELLLLGSSGGVGSASQQQARKPARQLETKKKRREKVRSGRGQKVYFISKRKDGRRSRHSQILIIFSLLGIVALPLKLSQERKQFETNSTVES